MAVTEIPTRFEHKCDGCGVRHIAATKSRPAYWTGLNIEADAYDWGGNACADASVKRLLCRDCTAIVHEAVNTAIRARAALSETQHDQG